MSEEQPNFKVTDRRLFNPDGSSRDIEREEHVSATESSIIGTNTTGVGSAPAGSKTSPAQTQQPGNKAGAASGQRAERPGSSIITGDSPDTEEFGEEDVPGAEDPASFVNFLMSLASNAASSLGMMEHPATGKRAVDLQLAKHFIDVLGMLQQKTEGNLDPREKQVFVSLLTDLRLQYVSLTKAAAASPSSPLGFSGRDITGGR